MPVPSTFGYFEISFSWLHHILTYFQCRAPVLRHYYWYIRNMSIVDVHNIKITFSRSLAEEFCLTYTFSTFSKKAELLSKL